MKAMADRAFAGSAAVGASLVVIGIKVSGVTFTDAETGILMAGGAALIGFAATVLRKVLGIEEE